MALRTVVQLARLEPRTYVQAKDLAKQENLPSKWLEAILLALRRGDFLESKVGSGGGYRLSRPPRHPRRRSDSPARRPAHRQGGSAPKRHVSRRNRLPPAQRPPHRSHRRRPRRHHSRRAPRTSQPRRQFAAGDVLHLRNSDPNTEIRKANTNRLSISITTNFLLLLVSIPITLPAIFLPMSSPSVSTPSSTGSPRAGSAGASSLSFSALRLRAGLAAAGRYPAHHRRRILMHG